jgi:ATP-dependent DNA ligase
VVASGPELDARVRCHHSGPEGVPGYSIVLDGEAVAHGPDGLPDFLRLLSGDCANACFFAFDMLMLDGDDLRPLPLSIRRNMLAELPLEGALQFSGHMDGPDGEAMFRHACAIGAGGHHFQTVRQAVPIGPVRALAQG